MLFIAEFILVFFSAVFPAQQKNSFIEWSADRKLNWSDFHAPPDKSSVNAALTSTTIKIDFGYNGESFQYHIHCLFDKTKSWGRYKNDYILAHEQGHFDIAEIYARLLNESLRAYQPDEAHLSKEVNKIYNDTMQRYYKEQEDYDRETNFSINHVRQAEWLKKIDSELSGLKNYSDYH